MAAAQKAFGARDAEGNLIDAQKVLREECLLKKDCAQFSTLLSNCEARVAANPHTSESCVEERIDLQSCVDNCVAAQLFKYLK